MYDTTPEDVFRSAPEHLRNEESERAFAWLFDNFVVLPKAPLEDVTLEVDGDYIQSQDSQGNSWSWGVKHEEDRPQPYDVWHVLAAARWFYSRGYYSPQSCEVDEL